MAEHQGSLEYICNLWFVRLDAPDEACLRIVEACNERIQALDEQGADCLLRATLLAAQSVEILRELLQQIVARCVHEFEALRRQFLDALLQKASGRVDHVPA